MTTTPCRCPWRSAALGFVNFTGTAGVWRADAIADAGGLEGGKPDRRLRADFACSSVAGGPGSTGTQSCRRSCRRFAAYRLQQRRWTQGWGAAAATASTHAAATYPSGLGQTDHAAPHDAHRPGQWPLWALRVCVRRSAWRTTLARRLLIDVAVLGSTSPPPWFSLFVAWLATERNERHWRMDLPTAGATAYCVSHEWCPISRSTRRMLPHHLCAFIEGLFGPSCMPKVRTHPQDREQLAHRVLPATLFRWENSCRAKATWRQTYFIVGARSRGHATSSGRVYFVLQGNYLAALWARSGSASCTAALRTAQTLDQLRRVWRWHEEKGGQGAISPFRTAPSPASPDR